MSRYAVQLRILRAGHENLEDTNVTGNDNLVTREPRAALRCALGSLAIKESGCSRWSSTRLNALR